MYVLVLGYSSKSIDKIINKNGSPMRLRSVGFNLTNVGSLIYLVKALANDSG